MQIYINSKADEKMLENYPDDPYSDVCLITQTRKLNLVLAYLSIDSKFFEKVDPDTQQIDLSHLNQEPLLRVIRSLYGDTLTANSVAELSQLFEIIKQLQIDEYQANIEKEIIEQKPYVLESLEFLEFSFKYDVLVENVLQYHVQSNLKVLESNRNYLQLNKISLSTFQTLVNTYLQQTLVIKANENMEQFLRLGEAQIINHAMENYFNRNNIKAANYFKSSNTAELETIWNKFHHTIYFPSETPLNPKSSIIQFPSSKNSNIMNNKTSITVNKTPIIKGSQSQLLSVAINANEQKRLRKKSDQVESINELELKRKRVRELEEQLRIRDETIASLQAQINSVKTRIVKDKSQEKLKGKKTSTKEVPQLLDQTLESPQKYNQDEPKRYDQHLAEQVEGSTIQFVPIAKKGGNKRSLEEQEDFTMSSIFEPAFDKKLPELKEVRTMKKMNLKNKFLP